MIVRRIQKVGYLLRTPEGKYVQYIDNTTHTGKHVTIQYLESTDFATVFYNAFLLDVVASHRKELNEFERINVIVTTTVETV